MKENGKLVRGRNTAGATMAETCAALCEGAITDCKPVPGGSNYVFLLSMIAKGQSLHTIYKPKTGEYPLWDFPDGTLYQRERAAYLVSESIGWSLIPPTVIRDGPYGVGVLQLFIATNRVPDYDALFQRRLSQFKRIAVFDWLTNNADRKLGHCLVGTDGRIWLIDHGLTFNEEPKLRTVFWHFAGQPVPEEILADLERFGKQLAEDVALKTTLRGLLSPAEVEALGQRLDVILARPVFPYSFGSERHRVPWPPY